jgi:hypothetical protein
VFVGNKVFVNGNLAGRQLFFEECQFLIADLINVNQELIDNLFKKVLKIVKPQRVACGLS